MVNVRFYQRRVTGVERYAREVVRRLPGEVVSLKPARPLSSVAGHLWEQLWLPRLVDPGDLLWSPANTGPLVLERQVVTVHDISPVDNPGSFRPAFRLWYRVMLPGLLRRARLILTSSKFSQARMLSRFSVPGEKIRVIVPGVDHNFFFPRPQAEVRRILEVLDIRSPYALAVGSLTPRKNLGRLLEAWRGGGFGRRGFVLVLVGSDGRFFSRRSGLDPGPGVIFAGYRTDDEVAALYSGARALVFPSFYEGFGLPLLEAMACGAPVLASATTALPEALGGAGLTFDPQQPGDIARVLEAAFHDEDLVEHLRTLGFSRSREFSWERTRDQVWGSLAEASRI